MARFIAIPVSAGDAFYLSREGFSVLVDGGRSAKALPDRFRSATRTDRVKVLLCTHNDADHANGILGYLQSGLDCGEVWLPGTWLSILPNVLRTPHHICRTLLDQVAEVDEPNEQLEPDSDPLESIPSHSVQDLAQGEQLTAGDGPQDFESVLEQADPWSHALPHRFGLWGFRDELVPIYLKYPRLSSFQAALLWSAIDAATRIRAIATEAFHRGVSVRWFQFDAATPGGGRSELKPINCRQIQQVTAIRDESLLAWLALTVSNRESLVFWSPPADDHPGVLFAADSDLAGVTLPADLGHAIVTAPHHGSEVNARAYKLVASTSHDASSVAWVRSDGRYKKRPGRSYLGTGATRFCTICRQQSGGFTLKQPVRLLSVRGRWDSYRTAFCSCQ